jgi:hypothetical protein
MLKAGGEMEGIFSSDPKWTLENFGKPQVVEIIGGPDRDRTDDLFHAMERLKVLFVDGKGLMSRLSRQNRPNRR